MNLNHHNLPKVSPHPAAAPAGRLLPKKFKFTAKLSASPSANCGETVLAS